MAVRSGEDFSYHDDCGNYAQGLTPNPLPAVNLSHLSVLDHFLQEPIQCAQESGYECYKEPGGVEMSVRKAIGIQLYGAARTAVITGLMRAVTHRGQNAVILRRLTFISFLICSRFKHCLPAGFALLPLFTFMVSHALCTVQRATRPDLYQTGFNIMVLWSEHGNVQR